jgi:hypothetical protein
LVARAMLTTGCVEAEPMLSPMIPAPNNQTYYVVSDPAGNSCGKTNVGNFTITYTLKTDTIQGRAVTRTTVTEQ